MHKPILFLGGMCGDLLLTLLDKKSILNHNKVNTFADCRIKKSRWIMKKFWNYSTDQKKLYYEKFSNVNKTCYTLTHDTDYCKNLDNVVQLYCSDQNKINWLSCRFRKFNSIEVVERVCEQQGFDLDNFENQYSDMIINWQQSFVFKNRFDIKNIANDKFIADIQHYFGIESSSWTTSIYKSWYKLQTFNFDNKL